MTRRNVYMTEETQKQVEHYMKENQITTHTEAVRRIINEYHEEKLKQESELKMKLNAIDKEVSILSYLVVSIAESMSAHMYDKRLSALYESAVEAREKEIKRKQSGLMFNE